MKSIGLTRKIHILNSTILEDIMDKDLCISFVKKFIRDVLKELSNEENFINVDISLIKHSQDAQRKGIVTQLIFSLPDLEHEW